MSSPNSFFQIIKPAEAATLTSIAILPTNNIVNTRTTYDIIFKTATTGDIKAIQIRFASNFDISAAARVIERSGIGSGSLSVASGNTLIYTVSSPVSVSAGTTIRLEIGRIVNSDTAGSFKVGIKTVSTSDTTIDGETLSPSFPIKDINGADISPGFMLRKTLRDDTASHAHGWDPNGVSTLFQISDSDVTISNGAVDTTFVSAMIREGSAETAICAVTDTVDGFFNVRCNVAPAGSTELHYVIIKLPANVVTSSLSVSSPDSTPSSESSSQYESLRAHDQIASEFR